ncbi:MAG: methylated-DNA--[protein]-cysteine S-methyltransferase [Bacteroidota bacterium]|jgi:O-6-methylguanine DNA methyltransferase|nr:methylated-DNA--[protein]-cysteine S-methyltransferase [Bacteroidales bacterium]MDI9536184.1 methylated-DNA--[protein]-cysteine S-methyltransferase [Bacteroidota bacterium]OQC45497.1 MAG: Methylated-DNA--protein-cysteine methyltransferase [Bacteroidetes bacterium ADurb.Bin028]NLP20709.1 methylated-DNA--[protein]-cysteine S-methyltransferase [Bacteroidales bacterium]HNY44139.1 methylated-DNA--[protein]-cysteine S-methyltransferase [Bacteroidales bacterium]
MKLFYTDFETPLGKMIAIASETELKLLKFYDDKNIEKELQKLKLEKTEADLEIFKNLKIQIKEYFEGKRKSFDIKHNPFGSDFQIKTWKAIQKISYGSTSVYKELARKISSEKAARAVANACGQNKIVIIIPCHRVIGSNQKIGGYSAGVWRKAFLLNLENDN